MPFAASVFAVPVPVGTPTIVAVMVSPAASGALSPAMSVVVILNSAVPEAPPPTTVTEVVSSEKDPIAAAFAGATDDNTLRPKAATATSVTRLKVVFVDICFLSISRSREFPSFGFELIS
jgi:hypothetical protein